jgi:hypothetical protein
MSTVGTIRLSGETLSLLHCTKSAT